MSDVQRLREKMRELEARRPKLEDDPEGYRRVTEEMARITDRSRAFQSFTEWQVT